MNTIIKLGLGIALAFHLSTPITIIDEAYGVDEAPPSFSSLSLLSSKELVPRSRMNSEQLSAIQGMTGICISCIAEKAIHRLARTPGRHFAPSVDGERTVVHQSNQFIDSGAVVQSNQSMVTQASRPSRQQDSVRKVQQKNHTPTTPFLSRQTDTNLAKKFNGSTQKFINQELSQIPNITHPSQSLTGSGERMGQDITFSTQEIIQQATKNGIVNATTINQQFNRIPNGKY